MSREESNPAAPSKEIGPVRTFWGCEGEPLAYLPFN